MPLNVLHEDAHSIGMSPRNAIIFDRYVPVYFVRGCLSKRAEPDAVNATKEFLIT